MKFTLYKRAQYGQQKPNLGSNQLGKMHCIGINASDDFLYF